MSPPERVALARLTYAQALSRTRAHSSAATWGRLLMAGRNLKAAMQDLEAWGSRTGVRVSHPTAGTARHAARSASPSPLRFPTLPAREGAPAAGQRAAAPPIPVRALTWTEVQEEWARSRALIERSRRLVAEARALCAALAAQSARPPVTTDR